MILFIKHWKDINGRMNRRQYFYGWIAYAFWMALIWSVIAMIVATINPDAKYLVKTMFGSIVSTIITTIFMIPLYTATIRRLNDVQFSPGFVRKLVLAQVLLGLIPHPTAIALTIPYGLVLFILCLLRTDKFNGWNNYRYLMKDPGREFRPDSEKDSNSHNPFLL